MTPAHKTAHSPFAHLEYRDKLSFPYGLFLQQTLTDCASAQSNQSFIKDDAEEHKDMQSLKVMTIIGRNARGFSAQMCVEHLMHVAIQLLSLTT